MAAPIPLRSDFDAALLRKLARGSRDPDQIRRLLALAEIYDGGSRSDAARSGGVGLQIVRDWVLSVQRRGSRWSCERQGARRSQPPRRPSAPSVAAGRGRRPDPGRPWRRTLAVDRSRAVAIRRVPGLNLQADAQPRTAAAWAFASSQRGRAIMRKTRKPSRLLKKLSRHCGRSRRTTGLRQTDRDLVPRRSPGRAEEQDHPPMGETRNAAFGAARPEDGVGLYFRGDLPGRRKRRRARSSLLQQRGHGPASRGNLAAVAPGAQAIVLLDQAGWHVSKKLPVPGNITLLPLPSKSPELNPVENIWQFMRDNWLSNRIFKSYDDIVDHCCFAWNKLIDMPWKIISIGTREWAYRS